MSSAVRINLDTGIPLPFAEGPPPQWDLGPQMGSLRTARGDGYIDQAHTARMSIYYDWLDGTPCPDCPHPRKEHGSLHNKGKCFHWSGTLGDKSSWGWHCPCKRTLKPVIDRSRGLA